MRAPILKTKEQAQKYLKTIGAIMTECTSTRCTCGETAALRGIGKNYLYTEPPITGYCEICGEE